MIIDGDMDELPACIDAAAVLAVAGDAVTGACEAAEPLDVDMDQVARLLAFVAANRHGGLQRAEGRMTDAEAIEAAIREYYLRLLCARKLAHFGGFDE